MRTRHDTNDYEDLPLARNAAAMTSKNPLSLNIAPYVIFGGEDASRRRGGSLVLINRFASISKFRCVRFLSSRAVRANVFVSDHFGIFNLICPLLFLSAILCWIILACGNIPGIISFAILYGFCSGSYVCKLQCSLVFEKQADDKVAMVPGASAAYANNLSEIGVRLGLTSVFPFPLYITRLLLRRFFASGVGALIGNPVVGYILGTSFRWAAASSWAGATILAGVACFAASRQILAKRRGTWKV